MNAAYKTYVVTSEIIGSDPDRSEFESMEEACKAYEEINLAYNFRMIHRTCGWRATEDMTLAKSLWIRYYNEGDNEIDVPCDSVLYEEYSIEDFRAEED